MLEDVYIYKYKVAEFYDVYETFMNYNENNVIVDSMTVGEAWPIYTWRKGGASEYDDHLYLQIGSAHDPFDLNNVLMEIDPTTKVVTFHNEARLLNGLSFESNTFNGSSLKDGTVDGSKIKPGTIIDASVTKLTNSRLLDGVRFDGTSNVTHYGLCVSASDDQIKIVSCPYFNKVVGSLVYVKFAQTNVHQQPQLNVNDTGACIMTNGGAPIDPSILRQDQLFCFVYDGETFNLQNSIDNNVKQVNSTGNSAKYNILLTEDAEKQGDHNGTSRYIDGVTIDAATKTLSIDRLVSPLYAERWLDANTDGALIDSSARGGRIVSFLKYNGTDGVFTLSGSSNGLNVTFTEQRKLTVHEDGYTYRIELIDNNGNATFPNTVTANKVCATTFEGSAFTGNAATATNAVNDGLGRNIVDTYITTTDAHNAFVNAGGDTMHGQLKLQPVAGEKNVIASTVGYVDDKVRIEVDALEEKILNGVSEEYDTLKELLEGIEDNRDVIDNLTEIVKGFVKFKDAQALTDDEKLIARTNIHAFSASGGTLADNGSIVGNESTFNNYNVVTATSSTIDFVDSDGKLLGAVQQTNSSIETSTGITVGDKSIKLIKGSDGTVTSYADYPTSHSSNEIATTQYITDRIGDALYIDNKQYSSIVTKSDNLEDNVLYYARVALVDGVIPWYLKVRVTVSIPGYSAYGSQYISELNGVGQTYSYKHFVHFVNEGRRSFDGLALRLAPKTAIDNKHPHLLGLSLYQTQSATTNEYSRTIKVEVLDSNNCTVELLETVQFDASVNKTVYSEDCKVVNTRYSGIFHVNDDKLNDSLIQSGTFIKAGEETVHPHTLVMEDAEGLYHSLPTSSGIGNTKLPTQAWLNPHKVYYYGGDLPIPPRTYGTEPDVKYTVGGFDISRSFNIITYPNVSDKLYIKCKCDEKTGLVQLAGNWLATYLPGNNDGFVYIYVGSATGDMGGYQTKSGHLAYTNTLYTWSGVRYEPVTSGSGTGSGSSSESIHPFLQNAEIERGEIDTSTNSTSSIHMYVHDKTSAVYNPKNRESVLAYLDQSVETVSGEVISSFSMVATDPTVRDNSNAAEIGVGYHILRDGTKKPYAYAITPDLDDISDSIATTGWTEERLQLLASMISEAFEQVTDTLVSSYASVESVRDVVTKYNELRFEFEQLNDKYQHLMSQHNAFLVDIANTYLMKNTASAEYISKTEATNLYLTKTEASNTYITQQYAQTYMLSRDEYRREIESAYAKLM